METKPVESSTCYCHVARLLVCIIGFGLVPGIIIGMIAAYHVITHDSVATILLNAWRESL